MAKRRAPKKRTTPPPLTPAQKGWATRRANEARRAEEARLERRRAAARKGVETRRANAARAAAEAKRAKRAEAARKGWETRRRQELSNLSDYERRDRNARAKGYESYWDERQSRVRARKAFEQMGVASPSIAEIDQLGVLGRGQSARELYHAARKILEKYEGPSTDQEVWALIRTFYKKRAHR